MAVDLNKLAEKLRRQNNIGVTRDGRLIERDPKNDGTKNAQSSYTTLEPQRFALG